MEYSKTHYGNIFDRQNLNFLKKWWIDIDKTNFLIIIGLLIFGLIISASSTLSMSDRIDVGHLFFFKKHAFFATIALLILFVTSLMNESKIKLLTFAGITFSILLLIAVPIFGVETKGAKRWISIFGFTLQPSEFAKTFFVLFNAYLLQKYSEHKWYEKYTPSAILYLFLIIFLITQPDFGMTITFTALWVIQLFLSGIPLWIFCSLGIIALMGSIGAYLLLPHVEDRINRFLNSGEKNYQVERSLDAFVNGSFFGKGPGEGVVKNFIPDAHTDFVFAIVGEEYGIISCVAFLILVLYLITRITKYALEEKNMLTYLIICGLSMEFAIQTVVNIGVSLKLLPTKGMTLPFISYGGSSMISMAICFGIILALSKRRYHSDVDYGNIKMMS